MSARDDSPATRALLALWIADALALACTARGVGASPLARAVQRAHEDAAAGNDPSPTRRPVLRHCGRR